ncbi:hypothetical protein LDENG_00013140, partial [Lucifuga dentata]
DDVIAAAFVAGAEGGDAAADAGSGGMATDAAGTGATGAESGEGALTSRLPLPAT